MTDQPRTSEAAARFNFLSVGEAFNLNHACRMLCAADLDCYQVGSSLTRPNYRDVDIRAILDDGDYEALVGANRARLKLLNTAVSEWLAARTGLPIDFQLQRRTEANIEFKGQPRSAVGSVLGGWVEP